jgi:3-oxoacyl-[acyl-carrier-protein] synthase II
VIGVTGVGVALPGVDSPADLFGAAHRPDGMVEPAAVLGKKGLRYKDRATQLGLCVAYRALTDAGLLVDGELTVDGTGIAVLVSSNLGNVDTACRVTKAISDEGGTRGISPMDAPNASSNIISSEVAIRWGLRGPNLMLCNGSSSGLDAVRWAMTLLRAGRAEQALVIGVEPDNDIVRALVGGGPTVDGGAAVVLERPSTAVGRGATVRAQLGTFARTAGIASCLAALGVAEATNCASWFVPEAEPAVPADLLPGTPRLGLAGIWGHTSGALGVLQCAAAVGRFDGGAAGSVVLVAGGDGDDASAGLVLHGPAGPDHE